MNTIGQSKTHAAGFPSAAEHPALPCELSDLSHMLGELGDAFALHEIVNDGQGVPVDYRFLWMNASFLRMLGVDRASVVGHTVKELYPGLDPVWISRYARVARTGESCRFEDWHKETGRTYEVQAHAMGAGRFAALFREVTAHRRLQRTLEEARKELFQKREEFERFTHSVSHDLKGPLHTIKGFAELIEQDLGAGDTATLPADLKRIFDAASRMQSMLEGLLLVSRAARASGPSMELRVIDVLAEAFRDLAGVLKDRDVRFLLPGPEALVYGDPQRLRQLFFHLVGNAIKFMGDQPNPVVEIKVGKIDGFTQCEIRDNGIGIAADDLRLLFGLFRKLNPKSEGLGVGLIVAKTLVEGHGGRIWAASQGPGQGSCFTFSLPDERRSHGQDA